MTGQNTCLTVQRLPPSGCNFMWHEWALWPGRLPSGSGSWHEHGAQHLGDCGAAWVAPGLAKCRAMAPSRSPPVSLSSWRARCSEHARMS